MITMKMKLVNMIDNGVVFWLPLVIFVLKIMRCMSLNIRNFIILIRERMTLIEQSLGRPIEEEASVGSCVYDNDDEDDNNDDAPLDRAMSAFKKFRIEDRGAIKSNKLADLWDR